MTKHTKIALLGGAGRTGKYLINNLLQKGYQLKLLLRKPEEFILDHSSVEVIKGDAVDFKSIRQVFSTCDAVINTMGQRPGETMVASNATRLILENMKTFRINRYITLAGINIDTPFDKKEKETIIATEWMKTNYPDIQADRQKAYSLLDRSDLDWTLVRVPFIEFNNDNNPIDVYLKDCRGSKVSASSIAEFLSKQLSADDYIRQSPFISNK